MSKPRLQPKQPRKRPPRRDDPVYQTMLHLAQPREARTIHKRTARQEQREFGADLIYDLAVKYGYRCVKCGCTRRLGLDHIRPISKGGRTEIDNLQLMCQVCNADKADQVIDYRPAAGERTKL